MRTSVYRLKNMIAYIVSIFLLLFVSPMVCLSQSQEVAWIPGPQPVDLGDNIAQIDLGEDYAFANSGDTIKLMERMGNPTSKREVGMIIPKLENPPWFVVFEYDMVGYIRDDEKNKIDSDAILESIRAGTEEANKIRKEKGFSLLNVVGWHEEPHYDVASHNLVWAILAESEGRQIVNYNVRLLGRHGYMSAVLVTDPSTLDTYKSQIENIIANFSYKKGKNYAEYVQGDKVAKYGLTALIAGGAGAAAVKLGFFKMLAKAWKLVVAGAVAFLAFLGKILKTITGRRTTEITYDPQDASSEVT